MAATLQQHQAALGLTIAQKQLQLLPQRWGDQIKTAAHQQHRGGQGAQTALALLANPSRFLSTVQVGLTFGSIIAATFGGAPLAAHIRPHLEANSWAWLHDNADVISRTGVSFVIGSMTIVFAEIVPKRLGLSNPEGLAVLLSRPMTLISVLASPLVSTLGFFADIVLRLFGKKRSPEDTMSEDELRMMVDQAQARYTTSESRNRRIALFCGPNETEELAGQMVADLLEADGYEVTFAGGGVANDEIREEIGQREPDVLLLFASSAKDAPSIRELIDNKDPIRQTFQLIDFCVIAFDVACSKPCKLVVAAFHFANCLFEDTGSLFWVCDNR